MFRFVAFTLLCFIQFIPVEAEEPNIVLIFADDLGWQEPAYAGSDFCETPHLDRLAADGMVFRHAYASAGNCQPSRACMLSGQYTPRHDVYAVGSTKRGPVELMRLLPIPGPVPRGRDPVFRTRPVSVIRKGDWKLHLYHEEWQLDGGREALARNKAAELYNIAADPGERKNLALSQTEKRDELLDDLLAWMEQVPAQLPSEANFKWKGK